MKLLFKQRLFSWLDSYDIYDESGATLFTVASKLAWGHSLHILDAYGQQVGSVEQVILTFLPKFELYDHGQYWGCLKKEFTLFHPQYDLDCNGWQVDGSLWEWDYRVLDAGGRVVATISKQLLNWTDTYVLDVADPEDALHVLMLVLAIDAEKCSRNNG